MAGEILGKAATLFAGKHATMTQAYGPEARGGACSAQVIISDEEVLFPYIREPEILICMSQEGYARNVGSLRRPGILIWDADLVKTGGDDPGSASHHIPATRFAEEMGSRMMANIVMLGFASAVCELVNVEALRQAVLASVPEPTKEVNTRAFERGREYGEAMRKSRAKQKRPRD